MDAHQLHRLSGGMYGTPDAWEGLCPTNDAEVWPSVRQWILTEYIKRNPCRRPRSWWQHDIEAQDEDRGQNETEAHFLQRRGLLTPKELRHLEVNPTLLEFNSSDPWYDE